MPWCVSSSCTRNPSITHSPAAMPESRRDRVVMVLGLAALLLFAANLVAFIEKQFFSHDRVHQVDIVEAPADQSVHEFVIAPQVDRRVIELKRLHGIREEAIAHASARLAEEVARLSEESARLADDGHTDAAANLRETVEQLRLKLDQLRAEMDAAEQEVLFEIQTDVSADADAQVETIMLSSDEEIETPIAIKVRRAADAAVEVAVVRAGSNR